MSHVLSTAAQKLLAWFSRYKTTATAYNTKLSTKFPKAERHGAFVTALDELVAYGY
jgi:hypothetical protein